MLKACGVEYVITGHSERRTYFGDTDVTVQKRVRAVYRRIGLPTRTTYNKEKVLAEMLHDKKAQGGQITVIKVPGLGCWRAETIPVEGLRPLLGVEE